MQEKRILFYPDTPHERAVILKILAGLGYGYSNILNSKYLLGFKWRDTTVYSLDDSITLVRNHFPFFNTRCTDISKRHIAAVFTEIFGEVLAINPATFSGAVVCKSNRNAAHDGLVTTAPTQEMDPEKVYQRLIDNADGDEVVDYRVPVMLDRMPLVYVKRRPISSRFSNKNASVTLTTPEALFTAEEQAKLLAYCRGIGMEYGEIDVLRDRSDGNLYVVDANNTPYGPPNGLTKEDSSRALDLLCVGFECTFLPVAKQANSALPE